MSNFFQELSARLVKDGNSVVNFYFKLKKASFVQDGIEIYGFKRKGYLSNYWQVYKMIRKTKPDVIISNFSYVNPAILFGKLLGVKTNIAWFHTVYGHSRPGKFKIWVKKQFLKRADVVIANSRVLEKELHTIYGVKPNNTKQVPFWTNISVFHSEHQLTKPLDPLNTLKIGCPGRLVADKNHRIVIDALASLKQSEHKLHLYIAGDGIYKSQLEQYISKLRLENEISLVGLLNAQQMASFYKEMDLIVLPSLNEAFGLVFIEAIAIGTPVLVSDRFGALNFIDNARYDISQFTFNPESKDDLIQKIKIHLNQNGPKSKFFQEIYNHTFEKEVIYDTIKAVINLK